VIPAERTPRIRLTPVPDDGVFVVRGDELDPLVLAEDAARFRERFSGWARFGVSAFHASSEDEIDAICQTRLIRFAVVVVFRRHDLEAAGVEVVPTFRTPHVTLCHEDLDQLVERLRACDHAERLNPYHVADEGGDQW
jgi:hypothetical protein